VAQNKKLQDDEDILEMVAIPSFKRLPIERHDVLKFAENLDKKITQLQLISEEKPKAYFFSLCLIKQFIEKERRYQD